MPILSRRSISYIHSLPKSPFANLHHTIYCYHPFLDVPNESKHVSVELAQIGATNSTSTETVFSDIGAQLWGHHTQVL